MIDDLINQYFNPQTATDNSIKGSLERRKKTLNYYRTLNIPTAIEDALEKVAFI